MTPSTSLQAANDPEAIEVEPSGKRERGKLEKRSRIIQAAREIFAEKGFAAATTQEISARAGIATGTLFLYAGSKEELLLIAFASDIDAVLAQAEAAIPRDRPLLDQLLFVLDALTVYHRRMGPELSRKLLEELLFSPIAREDRIKTSTSRTRRIVESLVQEAQRAGAVRRRLNAADAAEALFSLYYWQLLQWTRGAHEDDELPGKLRVALDIHVRGMAPRPR